MAQRRIVIAGIVFLLAAALQSCTSLRLEEVNFGWPVESALTVSDQNMIEETRYGLTFNVSALAEKEFEDTAALKGTVLRVLRSNEGYYYMTGPRFTSVYIFSPDAHELSLHSRVRVTAEDENGANGLKNPALNQRPPYIELLDGTATRVLLSDDGVVEQSATGDQKK